jgi:cytochrome P450
MNLNHADFFQNPYPYYAEMRAAEQPFWLAHTQDNATSEGIWLFSRHADALGIFKQTSAISKNVRSVRPPGWSNPFDLHLLHRDGADHLRLRRLVADYFSSAYLAKQEPRMTEVAEKVVRAFLQAGGGDLMRDLAEPIPLHLIADLIGVPTDDMAQIRLWSQDIGVGFDSLLISPAVLAQQQKALNAFLDYARRLIEVKRKTQDNNLLGYLIAAEQKGKLDRDELTAMLGFLLFAGHETTINLIGNGLWLLLSDDAHWRLLRDEPALIPRAVEEILRFESPEQRTSFRVAVQPFELNGIRIAPGQQLSVVIGAANRDETVFPDAQRFDPRRTPNQHLAFGVGIHHCLGKTLARNEARIVLGKALELLPSLQLSETTVTWRKNSFFRGVLSLHARLR